MLNRDQEYLLQKLLYSVQDLCTCKELRGPLEYETELTIEDLVYLCQAIEEVILGVCD